MRATFGPCLLLLLTACGVLAGVAEAKSERLERYEVVTSPGVLEIHAPTTGRALRVWGIIGVVLLAVAFGLQLRGGAGVVPLVLAGTAVMAMVIGVVAYLDRAIWRIDDTGLAYEGFAGRTREFRLDELGEVEVRRRDARGYEEKRGVREIWEVGILRSGDEPSEEEGSRLVRMWFRQQGPAEAMAARLREALGKPGNGS